MCFSKSIRKQDFRNVGYAKLTATMWFLVFFLKYVYLSTVVRMFQTGSR